MLIMLAVNGQKSENISVDICTGTLKKLMLF